MPFHIVAHRGGCARAPENTTAAFDRCLQAGFSHFETDVQLTLDGKCVVFHDEALERTTDGKGKVCEATCDTIQALDAGSWFSPGFAGERVLLLEELLAKYASQAHIHLELKSDQRGLVEAVSAVLQQAQADLSASDDAWAVPGLTITSFHIAQLKRSLELLPHVRHSWLVQAIDAQVVSEAVSLGVKQLCPRADTVSVHSVNLAVTAGMSVRAWCIKHPGQLLPLQAAGVHGGTVDWPEDAMQALS